MRGRTRRAAIAAVAALVLGVGGPAWADAVESLDVRIDLGAGGDARIEETWTYDFGAAPRRFVERSFPVFGSRTDLEPPRVRVLSVEDESGRPLRAVSLSEGGPVVLRIDAAGEPFVGRRSFVVRYAVHGVASRSGGERHYALQASGGAWYTPIGSFSATVRAPASRPVTRSSCEIISGYDRLPACSATSSGSEVRVVASRPLAPGEVLMVGVSTPAAPLAALADGARGMARGLRALGVWVVLPLLGSILLVVGVLDGRSRRRMHGVTRPPSRLGPAEAAAVYSARARGRAFAATVVDLARRGHLEVERGSTGRAYALSATEWTFRHRVGGDPLRPYEAIALDALLGQRGEGRLSASRAELPRRSREFEREVLASVRSHGRAFRADPESFDRALVVAIVLGAAAAAIAWLTGTSAPAVALSVTVALLWLSRPRFAIRTQLGRKVREELVAFRRHLRDTPHSGLPEDMADQEMLTELLPYAIALGASDPWVTAFDRAELAPDRLEWLRAEGEPIAHVAELERMVAAVVDAPPTARSMVYRGRYTTAESGL